MSQQKILDDLAALDTAAATDASAGTTLADVTTKEAAALAAVGDALVAKKASAEVKQAALDQTIADLEAAYGVPPVGSSAGEIVFGDASPAAFAPLPRGKIGDGHLIQWAIDHKALVLGAIKFFAMLFGIPAPILTTMLNDAPDK